MMNAEEIKYARGILNFSQRKLAEKLESMGREEDLTCTHQLVSLWEKGETRIGERHEKMLRELLDARLKSLPKSAPAMSDGRAGLTLTPELAALIAAASYHLNILEISQPAEGPLGDSSLVLAKSLARVLDALPPEAREKVIRLAMGTDRKVESIERSADERRARRV